MITLTDITKTYGPLTVLDHISLDITPGQITAIVGPSGAGKTTLLQIAGSLASPDSGRVCYDGTDITTMRDKTLSRFRNQNIGFVFQFHRLLPEFTALENVSLPALIGGRRRREAEQEARRLLERLGLGGRLDHRPAQLSGGERQRCAIARALVNHPTVVLADEPTGSLDSHNRTEVQEIFRRLRSELGQTFVIVTHDPTMAAVADRVVSMADGRITGITTTENGNRDAETLPETGLV